MRVLLAGLGEANGSVFERVLQARADTFTTSPFEDLGRDEQDPIQVSVIEGSDIARARDLIQSIRGARACRDCAILVVIGQDDLPTIKGLISVGVDDVFVASLGPDMLAVRLDIVESVARMRAERRAAEEEQQRFFALSIDMLCIAGLDGYFRTVSPSWTRILGWTSKQLCSAPWIDFIHPDDVPATLAAGRMLGEGATVSSLTNRYRCPDGSYRWLEWQAAPAPEQQLIYAVARDVTDKHCAQQALQNLTHSLSTTLSSIGDGVIATNSSAVIERMNPAAERLTRWTAEEAAGHPIDAVLTLVNAKTRERVANPAIEAIASGTVIEMALATLLVRRDGTEVPIADSCAPITDVDGKITGAVLVFRDTTVEEEAKVTQARIQQRLMFADRMASVGTLAAGVAHEINNPLSYVVANLEMLDEDLEKLACMMPPGVAGELQEMLGMRSPALSGSGRSFAG